MAILSRRSFWGLMVAQFFGAFNDNVFKIVAALALLSWVDPAVSRSLVPISGMLFAVPFLLFSLGAGRLADRCSKTLVIRWVKSADLLIVMAASAGLFLHSVPLLLVALFLLGTQSAFFGPSKYGILPEIQPEDRLSSANAILNASTFLAILVGTIVGTLLKAGAWTTSLVMGVGAVGGLAAAFFMKPGPAVNPSQPLQWNPVPELLANWRLLKGNRGLKLSLIAVSYFWFLGAVLQMNTLVFVKQDMALPDTAAGKLLTAIVIGVAFGSLLAGRLSRGKVELGLVPLGAAGISLFTLDLGFSAHSFHRTLFDALFLGASAGFFTVPLNTLIQAQSPPEHRGRILSTANFLSFVAIAFGSGFLWLMSGPLGQSPARVFIVLGVLSLLATGAVFAYLPQVFVRLMLYLFTNVVYKITVVGAENVPTRGPALLVPNHVSYADPFLVGGATSRWIRFMMFREFYNLPFIRPFVKFMDVIPISAKDNPREILKSLGEARRRLEEGHVVCIFAEGAITRFSQVLGFRKGFERVVKDLNVPIIPVHLDRVWGSVFSFERAKFFWKFPRKIPYPVTVSFGKPLPPTAKADEVRQGVLELGSESFQRRLDGLKPLHQHFFRLARRQWGAPALSDSTGITVTYGRLAVGSLWLSRVLKKQVGTDRPVGVLLPPGVPASLVNLALLYAGHIPVHLNYSLGRAGVDVVCREAGVSRIVTARKMADALDWGADSRLIFMEDLPPLGSVLGVLSLLTFKFFPAAWVERWVAPAPTTSLDDLASLLFTSGSTGTPKGVMLTHANIHANIQGLQETYQLTAHDTVLGVLPFFHSFGFTATLWLPLLTGCQAAYHRSPLEPTAVKKTIRDKKVTVMLGTPTFLQMWLKKLTKEDVSSVRFAMVGAEKLSAGLAQEFREKLGVPVLEGYGTTELSPAVCVSVLDVRQGTEDQKGWKPGKVGRPLPGVSVRIVHPETGERLPDGTPGLLLVRGPNVMKGYWNQPTRTAEVLRDGWYVTGDIAAVDPDGFVEITDRLSRFSKIGGEMVPHGRVEEILSRAAGEAEARFLVLSLPDEKRGEKLAVLHHGLCQTVDDLYGKLVGSDTPKLWIPDRRCFFAIPTWPLLGTGKVDMVKAKAFLAEKTSCGESL